MTLAHMFCCLTRSGGARSNEVQTNASRVRGATNGGASSGTGAAQAVDVGGGGARALSGRRNDGDGVGAEEREAEVQTRGSARAVGRSGPAVGAPQRDEAGGGRQVLNGVEERGLGGASSGVHLRGVVVDVESARAVVDGAGIRGVGERRVGDVGGDKQITAEEVHTTAAGHNSEVGAREATSADGLRQSRVVVDGEAARESRVRNEVAVGEVADVWAQRNARHQGLAATSVDENVGDEGRISRRSGGRLELQVATI
jgi:hypothetical protein